MSLAAVVLVALGTTSTAAVDPVEASAVSLPDSTPVHLGIALRPSDPEGLQALLAAQQTPGAPSYHAWLTPEAYAERFGLEQNEYSAVLSWFSSRGFAVTTYPNRTFFEALGTVGAVRRALGVQVHAATTASGQRYRTFDGDLRLPTAFAAKVVHISGLDTRPHLRHRINVGTGRNATQALGPTDIRLEYDLTTLIAGGAAAKGLTTAVLGTQEGTSSSGRGAVGAPFVPPSTTAIQAFFTSYSNATATYNPIVIPNANDDFDTPGANQEYQLDVEMQSVGAPNATDIDLALSPSSEVFTTGAEYVVNNLSTAVVVSTSLGLCESEESEGFGSPTSSGSEAEVFQQTVQQALSQGQTWFAAAGDSGADDCDDQVSGTSNGFGKGNATVDFPGSLPEIVDLGGTQFSGTPSWDTNGNLTAFVTEAAWNEGQQGGAGGGGQSLFYAKPAYQKGVGPEAADGARDVPDLALTAASGTPGVAVYDCGSGQDSQSCPSENTGTGDLDIIGGTSVASPLAAGFFAALSGQVGCRLGDIHQTLYTLGNAQLDGGAAVFHDVTTGNNTFDSITGFSAGTGFDLVTGWGTLDVAALIANWPACSTGSTTGATSAGSTSTGGATTTTTTGTTGAAAGTPSGSSTGAASSTSGGGTSAGGTTGGVTAGTSAAATTGHGVATTTSTTASAGATSGGSIGESTTTGTGTTGTSTGTASTTSGRPAEDSSTLPSSGCSCVTAGDDTVLLGAPLMLLALLRRKRRS